MSTLLVAAILIVSIIAFVWIFIKIDTKRTRKKEQVLFDNFNRIATENEILITRHEKLSKRIIGLDNLRKIVLVYEFENPNAPLLIHLADLNSCTLVKEYGQINAGNEKKPMMERYLQSIDLKFNFKNKPEPVSVSLYEYHVNNIDQMVEMEARGKDWEAILSQIIPKQTMYIA